MKMERDIVTIEKFIDSSQWMMWKFQVRVNLMASDLFKYVDGKQGKPGDATSATYAKDLMEWTKMMQGHRKSWLIRVVPRY